MDNLTSGGLLDEAAPASAFRFTGNWREFLPIALTNFALTIVTLGIYRFWAKARERRYLWSRTEFIDDSLEWTGTGKEMFIGFLIVMAVFVPAVLFLNFGVQALVLRGAGAAAGLLTLALYVGFFYFYHVARFRALRYRFSRTYWHGIRGGSDDAGWGYGRAGMGKMFLGSLAFGFLIPWALTQLWNRRWGAMSFGSHEVEAWSDSDGLMSRWLLVYLAPLLGVLLSVIVGGTMSAASPEAMEGAFLTIMFSVLLFYLVVLLAGASFYALFYRTVVGATSVAGIQFEFTAGTKDWLKLYLGNFGLVIVTLGFGLFFLSYRNWSFMVRHMEATGVIDLDFLTQSTTRAPGDAEGLADALDIGAI